RQVAVLAKELRRRDELTWRLSVGLVRRAEDHHDVTAAARVQRVGAVDVAQLLLLEHLQNHLLLARDVRVVEVLERPDALVADRLVLIRRESGGVARGWVTTR